jgi:hypothetical protein
MALDDRRRWPRPQTPSLFLLLAFLVVWLMASPPAYAQTTLSLAEYGRLLADSYTIVADLDALSPEAQDTILRRLTNRWAAVTAVTLPDNQELRLDHSFVLTQLRARPADAARLQGLFREMEAAVNQWPDARPDADDLAALAQILAQPEFDWVEPARTWRDWLRDWLLVQLSDLLDWLLGRGELSSFSWLNWLLTLVGFVLLAGAVLYALRSLRASWTGDADLNGNGRLVDEAISADEALRRAQHLSQEGDQRTAIRYLYLSALLLLEERGLLRHDRSQTNREYLDSVAHRPELAAILREVVEIFDQVWYGFQPIDDVAVGHYTARVAELRRLPAARPAPDSVRRDDETI